MDIKNDQSAKADAGKPRLTLVPRKIIWAIAKIREYGCKKYASGGEDNWKRVEVERYRDAMYRHFMAYLDDPHGVDHESGLPILWHCACNLAFLIELEDEAIGEMDAEKVEAKSLYGKCDGCKYEDLEDSPCTECGREFPDRYERRRIMAYKTGDKFVIEIDSVMTNKNGTLYGIKGFKSLVFDDYGLEQLERIPGEGDCIKVGDVVFSDATGDHAIVTRVDGDDFYLLFDDGSCGSHSQTYERWEKAKTACRLDLNDLFNYIRNRGNNDRN